MCLLYMSRIVVVVCLQLGAPPSVAVTQPSMCSGPAQPQLAEMQLQLEATRREVAQLRANQRHPEETCGQAAAERAAARAEDQRIASGHRELQEAWKGVVDELKEQLKVIRGISDCHLLQVSETDACCLDCLAHAPIVLG
jgi:hypothetical protein